MPALRSDSRDRQAAQRRSVRFVTIKVDAGHRVSGLLEIQKLSPLIAQLGKRATLRLFDDADQSFHVPARTGRKHADVRHEILDVLAEWTERVVAA